MKKYFKLAIYLNLYIIIVCCGSDLNSGMMVTNAETKKTKNSILNSVSLKVKSAKEFKDFENIIQQVEISKIGETKYYKTFRNKLLKLLCRKKILIDIINIITDYTFSYNDIIFNIPKYVNFKEPFPLENSNCWIQKLGYRYKYKKSPDNYSSNDEGSIDEAINSTKLKRILSKNYSNNETLRYAKSFMCSNEWIKNRRKYYENQYFLQIEENNEIIKNLDCGIVAIESEEELLNYNPIINEKIIFTFGKDISKYGKESYFYYPNYNDLKHLRLINIDQDKKISIWQNCNTDFTEITIISICNQKSKIYPSHIIKKSSFWDCCCF